MWRDVEGLDPARSYPLREHIAQGVNTPPDDIRANIRSSIRRQLPQVRPYAPGGQRVALLAGGPSLADSVDELRRLRRRGWKLVCLNATHEWAQDHGLTPSACIILDARPFCARFVSRPVATCRYLIASQCAPAVFDALAGHDVHIWHAAGEEGARILDRYYRRRWMQVPGGSTVGTRALWLLYILGMRHVRVYGLDSCLRRRRHHAYRQPENDAGIIHVVRVGRRRFRCHPWMAVQADEFLRLAGSLPDDLDLDIRGDGLIAYIVRTTAERGEPPRMVIEREEAI